MIHIIYNENSGNKKALKFKKRLEKFFDKNNVECTFHKTEHSAHATEIARELSLAGAKDVIAMGGDGTLHEVLNGIDPTVTNLGIIPCGSGNDFASAMKIPKKPEKAAQLIIDKKLKPTDYYDCSGVKGINVIGTGIDVETLLNYQESKMKNGKFKYLVCFLRALKKFRFYKFKVTRDDGTYVYSDCLLACLGNGKQIGGGIKTNPKAIADDGLLDLVIVKGMKKSRVPLILMKLMGGKFLDGDKNKDVIIFERHKHCVIDFENEVVLQIDGEIYKNLPFDVSIISNQLKFYRP